MIWQCIVFKGYSIAGPLIATFPLKMSFLQSCSGIGVKKMNLKKLACLLIASGAMAFGALPAQATLILYLDAGGGNDITVVDNGAGDLDSAIGSVRWAGTLGTWLSNFSFTQGTSNSPGTSGLASLDLFSFYATSRRGGNLHIELIEDNFLSPIGQNLAASSSVVGYTSGKVSFESHLNDDIIGSLGAYSGGAFSGSTGATVNTTPGFSLMQIANIEHRSYGVTEFRSNISITSVAEPTTLGILGLGLIGFAYMRRRRES